MAVGEIDKVIDTPVVEETEPKFQYPGMPTTCDGAEAVVWVETNITQAACNFSTFQLVAGLRARTNASSAMPSPSAPCPGSP